MTIGIDSQAAYRMQKSAAPITRLAVAKGTILTGGGGHLIMAVKRLHPQVAAVVLNWLLSVRGEEIYGNAYEALAARVGIKTEAVSQLAYPLSGEKLFTHDEDDLVNATILANEVAEWIYTPLLKSLTVQSSLDGITSDID